ncbi:MAG TPA: nuclear transport factor 2 family protein [Trebonia sp.]|jgi:hypothetical protein
MSRIKIPVEDRLEIMELFARYCWGLNTGDADAVLSCFAEGGSLEHLPQGVFQGEDIRKLLDHLWYAKPGWFIGRQHLANHFVMESLGEQEVHVTAYFSILQHNLDYRTNFVFGLGNWDNVCTRQDGDWLFKSVAVVKWMGDTVPWHAEDRARTNAPAGAII